MALAAGLLIANLRDSEPFLLAAKAWESVAASAGTGVQEIRNEINATLPDGWKGEAASAFLGHVDDPFVPALVQYREHADALAHLGKVGAEVLDESVKAAITMVVSAIVVFGAYRALSVAFPQSRFLARAAGSVWAAMVVRMVATIGKEFFAFADASGKVAEKAGLVRESFLADARTLGHFGQASIKPVAGSDKAWLPPAGGQDWTPQAWEQNWAPVTNR